MRSFSRAAAKEEQKKQYTDHANIRRKSWNDKRV
jgi:hypothetical protein